MLICCVSLSPATITSVPVYDFAIANVELGRKAVETYYECCGKSICKGCMYSLMIESGKIGNCPFCNSDRDNKTHQVAVEGIMKRVETNDAGAMQVLAGYYHQGIFGLHQDRERAIALWKQAAELGSSQAHYYLGSIYHEGRDLKMTKSHYVAAAMAGHELARCNLGSIEGKSGNMERAVKHWMIAASTGSYTAMSLLKTCLKKV